MILAIPIASGLGVLLGLGVLYCLFGFLLPRDSDNDRFEEWD